MKTKLLTAAALAATLLFVAACAPVAQVAAPVGQQQPVPQMVVSGSGQVTVVPDLAYINIGVRSQADTVSDALQTSNTQAKAIKDALLAEGVEAKDVQTSSFNVYPMQDYSPTGEITRYYYVVENTVYVTIRNLDKLGKVLDVAAANGANNIYGISFDVAEKTEAYSQARKLAVEYAKTQASELADAAGVKLGSIINISSSTYSAPTLYDMSKYGAGMGGGAAAQVPVSAGQMIISADVTLVYAIQ